MQPRWPSAFANLVGFLSKHYFNAEVRGVDRMPTGAALLVGNHNANPVIVDSFIFAHAYFRARPNERQVAALAHNFAFKVPIVNRILTRLGAVPASHESAERVFANKGKVLVYPGGDWESCRPSRDRDRIDFHNRSGFVKLALRANVPIVPIVAAGAHDGWHVLTRGDRFAEMVGLKKYFRIGVFPVALALPFGLAIGPAFPFIPLPRKILIECLPPYIPTGHADSEDDLRGNYEAVTASMQTALTRLAAELPRSRRATKALSA